jgi:ATP-dependent helicase/DNAse subunit B
MPKKNILYLSPSSDTSFDHSLAHIRALKAENPFLPVTLLLPRRRDIDAYRRRMGDMFNVELYEFRSLGRMILEKSGSSVRLMDNIGVRRLVRWALWELKNEGKLSTFEAVWDKPGFVNEIINWLREVRAQRISLETFRDFATKSGDARENQLVEIYQLFLDMLNRDELADSERLQTLAGEKLRENPSLLGSEGVFIALGFDQFSPLQINLLQALSTQYASFSIYLLWDEKRPSDSLALSRVRDTRRQLEREIELQIDILPEEDRDTDALLIHVRESLFERDIPARKTEDIESVRAIAAPSREMEVRYALREVKRLLLRGVSTTKILLLAPHPAIYLPWVRAVAEEYQLPIEFDRRLADNPAVIALMNVLSIYPEYSWRETMDALRSPYIQQPWLNERQINLLDKLSRLRPVVSGLEQWKHALQPVTPPEGEAPTMDESITALPEVQALEEDEIISLAEGVTQFFVHVQPPDETSYEELTWWLQTHVLGLFPEEVWEQEDVKDAETSTETSGEDSLEMISLNILACCKRGANPQRDLLAIERMVGLLRDLNSPDGGEGNGEKQTVSWEEYFAELRGMIEASLLPPRSATEGVYFSTLEAGRTEPVDYLFVLGLGEGEFPSPPRADPLYAPSERENHPLPLLRKLPGDDASLWWQVISNCRNQLTILHPYLDENGAEWMPSPFWDELVGKIDGIQEQRIPVAARPAIEDCASQAELLIALAAKNAQTVPHELHKPWEQAKIGQAVIEQRLNRYEPLGNYEGMILDREILDQIQRDYGIQRGWSASKLNNYNYCPFKFFVQYVLKLETLPDPSEGMDVMQRGSLLHKILEVFYNRVIQDRMNLNEENVEPCLELLEEVEEQILSSAPIKYGFRPGVLWRYEKAEIQRLLAAFVSWECGDGKQFIRYSPYKTEVKFGFNDGVLPTLKISADIGIVWMHGLIDRIDRDQDGNLRIIDYKSGSSKFYKSAIEEGTALQTALYALAAEAGGTNRVTESYYLHIPSRETSGKLTFQGKVEENETVQAAQRRVFFAIDHISRGEFPAAPSKAAGGGTTCRSRCDMATICRVTRQAISKAKRRGF